MVGNVDQAVGSAHPVVVYVCDKVIAVIVVQDYLGMICKKVNL